MDSQVALAAYRPHEGKEKELVALLRLHIPLLYNLGLITDREPLTMKASDGTYIEVIEWANAKAATRAHGEAPIAELWEKIGKVSDSVPLGELEESKTPFSHYQVVSLGAGV